MRFRDLILNIGTWAFSIPQPNRGWDPYTDGEELPENIDDFPLKLGDWSMELWNDKTDEGWCISLSLRRKYGARLHTYHIPAYWWKDL